MTHKQQPVAGQPRTGLATPREIAAYCQVPIGTIYQWSSRGGGPKFLKVGRHLRARWEDVESWLSAQVIEGTNPS